MSIQVPDSTIKGRLIGVAALNWLSSGQHGEVVASISRAIYLSAGKDDLYWITGEGSPMHRRCLQISSPVPKLTVGSSLEVRDQMLIVPSWGSLDFSHPQIWNPPAVLLKRILTPEELAGRVSMIYRLLLELRQPAGLGWLIPEILLKLDGRPLDPSFTPKKIFLSSTRSIVDRIISLLLRQDLYSLPETAMKLVGLGEGLTPSGDDFLGGLLFCLHLLQSTYPETLFSPWDSAPFLEQCKPRTHFISYILLRDHASGHTLEPLHSFASALLQDQSLDQVLPFVEELILLGHSTGWDLLTGFLTGMIATVPRKPPLVQYERNFYGNQTEDRKSQ